jgi:hypothetical protein
MTEAIESDAKSVSPKPSQTRFNFYNAEEINKQVSKDGEDNKGDQQEESPPKKETRRFNFYNAAEVNEASGPTQFPTTRRPTSQPRYQPPLPAVAAIATRSSSARHNTEQQPPASVNSNPTTPGSHPPLLRSSPKSDIAVVSSNNLNIDSNEILRSLQESERQRWRKKTFNQRTAPTQRRRSQILTSSNGPSPKDEDILQTSANSQEDVVMQSRMDVEGSSERREAERQSRKERMAMYASKIMESKGETLSLLSPESPKKQWIPIPGSLLHSEELIMRRSESDHDLSLQNDDDDDDEEWEQSQSVKRVTGDPPPDGREEEQNVERVLSAILERSKVGERTNVNHESELQALSKAMENLLQPTLSFETISTVRSRRPNRRESDEHNLQAKQEALKQMKEALDGQAEVDELREPNVKNTPRTQDHVAEAPVTSTEAPGTLDTSSDDFDDECDVDSDAASPSYVDDENEDLSSDTDDEHEILDDEDNDDDDDDDDNDDDDDDDDDCDPNNVSLDETTLTNVLGPLSRGDSTGVVLEAHEVPPLPPPPTDDGPAPLSPSSIYETLSSAVRDSMSFMTLGGYSLPIKDKYSTHDEDEEHVQVESLDNEAHELMRSLCAHLLPFGVDKSCKDQLKSIPVWDESNPDEAGYRIIRLTKLQLRRVEREFNLMIKSVKQSSERDLNGRLKQTDDGDDWGNGESNDDFERDLEEAEELLDEEEKRQEEAARAITADEDAESQDESGSDIVSSAGSETEESSRSNAMTNDRSQSPIASETDDDTLLTSHPVFPGVKTPGQGEIGDLEFFHLPIIYKSKVTGFEPTKDLFLEQGNVVAGQYLVESELGSAAFSTAYRCVDLSSETTNEDGRVSYFRDMCVSVELLIHLHS